jgi:DNA-binding MarR family transcriptional regulator
VAEKRHRRTVPRGDRADAHGRRTLRTVAGEQDVRWLTPAELRAWIALSMLCEALPSALDAQLKRDAGLNYFEYQVMAGLSDAPGNAIRMSDLAAFASGSPSRLSHAVTRLEGHGWVERRPSAEDSRSVEAVLTEAGRQKMVETAPGHVCEARRVALDALTPEQVGQLEEIATALLQKSGPLQAQRLRELIADGRLSG